ncbi:DUF5071 domain-containing protein [Cytobacillus oceanisediminis]|uniref:DUF5071 domain-containing protein n=1 Tax=Niallia alba TaxID=2729105 RepID=A0A7Y0PKK7_9BACI|nr:MULTISPECIES: DUF5071 domain-containing protein [Bacillaceae]EOR24601.1 tartrate dehydratase alpha subunit/Fumarate hydratase class I [Niallia nealsonii AAU1]MBZ9534562.1 DUF5071 domain-containing protein [Cytobacillus oceanisediminis]NMO76052.1 DUF5071 domain-containing protein [Niallia alba]UTI43854.1 DUF5071 domain-containing protein [Niallia sp. RD1]
MKNYTEYLPRDKHDSERVNQLKNLSRKELVLLLPGLMEWIQDMNWPVAEEVSELLLTCPDEIVPLIKNVLATNDDVWKYWCLIILVKRLPEDLRMQFKMDLIRLAESPTAGERLEELDEIALEILQMFE